jgi:hypothetical protein
MLFVASSWFFCITLPNQDTDQAFRFMCICALRKKKFLSMHLKRHLGLHFELNFKITCTFRFTFLI